ncbi:rhodanese-like domain-containing protein [Leptolyngbya sp. 7M]|uniref:rhodanese-like domain-containing protein n=1 Tax=Leptolyngbya sp. 7M TaxID=2812896 RepID=UPI001B8AB575|nr:rhodanese-like domain-containing protein [Leptolyngbya sp. 7M]QYO62525.1 rhodanese-like domain-containing protein [Leptolyngbya sp. 7M]
MSNVQDAIVNAKDKLPNVTPTPPGFHPEASVHELKSRLLWGEPGLSIIDVRDHDVYNQCRIRGAMNMPMDRLPGGAEFSLQKDRDIYVYGASAEDTSQAVRMLREAGFRRVAELKGGLDAWREIDGPLEGVDSMDDPGPDAYNVFARLQAFNEEKAKEKRMK